ncbi:endonuclease/exonuclease/phosphatase family protein [Plantactinospora siamensis]|uniref:Endonuclease/exonuclease/phosphatase family protein n=1 Tax=Plantactinospora siamensis TaxID=555372 RepID=A0ABV6P4J8_9ACTN
MADRSFRTFRRALAVVFLVAAIALLPGPSVAAGDGSTTLRALQMNLCNSGRAGCYTGRSVTEAAATIRSGRPDLVTLNEICRDDTATLRAVLADVHGGGTVVAAFQAAGDRPSGDVTRCANGQPFGVGLLLHLPGRHPRHTVRSGIYPAQDAIDPEERSWLCITVPGVVRACTTHLVAGSGPVALAQCRHLLGTVLPAIDDATGYAPTVLSGDLNLRLGGAPDVRDCVPSGWSRVDDGAVQQIVAGPEISIRSSRPVSLHGTTDHPALLATLTTHPGSAAVPA